MRRVSKHSKMTSAIVDYGMVMHKNKLMAYAIMHRLGTNLESYFELMDRRMYKKSVFDLGTSVLSMLEAAHKAGYVYNDLKLDNILIGYGQKLPKPDKK